MDKHQAELFMACDLGKHPIEQNESLLFRITNHDQRIAVAR
jgi:hypothetical protein